MLFLASFAIPYVSPESFPLLSIMSLAVPLFIFLLILFMIFWLLVGLKKQFLLSFFCLLLAVVFSFFPYKFKGKEVISGSSMGVMNYNVRMFNTYEWIDDDSIPDQIASFIAKNKIDILSMQEYSPNSKIESSYPYQYKKLVGKKNQNGLVIFSNYKIVNQGSLDFEHTNNNAIFVDVLKNNDTIRVYNLHLESFGIKPDSVDLNLNETRSRKLIYRLKNAFVKQQNQVEKFLEHKRNCRHKVIICGDFNNTSYSWAYKHIKDQLLDSYLEAGEGFGETYSFNRYPLRIDFILVDDRFIVNQHKNFDIRLSDHEPVLARIGS